MTAELNLENIYVQQQLPASGNSGIQVRGEEGGGRGGRKGGEGRASLMKAFTA